jgi:hypothetical protein
MRDSEMKLPQFACDQPHALLFGPNGMTRSPDPPPPPVKVGLSMYLIEKV